MDATTFAALTQPEPSRAALAAELYSYGLDDLGDSTLEHLSDPMGAWEAWVQEARAAAVERIPELATSFAPRAA